MSFYAQPEYSRARVDAAGRRAAEGDATDEDIEVIENWRASHAQLLNTFKQILYNRQKKVPANIVQRLKRRPTIIDKLSRDPKMRVRLSQMQDIAGCRVIFQDLGDLYDFKTLLDEGGFSHQLLYEKDYIQHPKEDGYRGIHQIYRYYVEPRKKRAGEDQPWNGMRVEIQLRSLEQHVWATAVETIGLLTTNNPKFHQGNEDFIAFFRICSEMIARQAEGVFSSLPDRTNAEVVREFKRLDRETHIFDIFERVNARIIDEKFEKTSILIFFFADRDEDTRIEVRSYDSINTAIREYNQLEKQLLGIADVVLVKAEGRESMRSAYRNYFADTAEFVHIVRNASLALERQDFKFKAP